MFDFGFPLNWGLPDQEYAYEREISVRPSVSKRTGCLKYFNLADVNYISGGKGPRTYVTCRKRGLPKKYSAGGQLKIVKKNVSKKKKIGYNSNK